MCGIIGYAGSIRAAPILTQGLTNMEYRGYDSAGVGIHDGRQISIKKDTGKIDEIKERLGIDSLNGNIGIAHTRWATHGKVSQVNAHPHTSCESKVTVVHNGIIDNYQKLRINLETAGHLFISDTDSEVIAHLIEDNFKSSGDYRSSIIAACEVLEGSFAFVVIFKDNADTIFGVRKDAPLILGIGKNENFIASDILAFIKKTDEVIFLENFELVEVSKDSYQIMSLSGEQKIRESVKVAWEASDISRKDFSHFTLKEIHEQQNTIRQSLNQNTNILNDFCDILGNSNKIYIVASGTSLHAGFIAKQLLARVVKIPSEVVIASEFISYADLIDSDSVILAISQSGETADVLDAIRTAKGRRGKIISIVNTPGSSLTRESDQVLFLNCGPEIGVAATKSFTSQLAIIYQLVLILSGQTQDIAELTNISNLVPELLSKEEEVSKICDTFASNTDFYFVGRGLNFPIALEGALKLKELAYVHAEGLAAGELKHGTLALIEEGTPVIVLNPDDETYYETLNNASEMKARGAKIIGISNKPNPIYDYHLQIPTVDRIFYSILEVIILQFLAYYGAISRHHNPDYPRNLAKSVTVK